MTCRCQSNLERPRAERARPRNWRDATITVVRGGRAAIVRLAMLPARKVDGALCVRLVDIWSAAQLPGDLLSLTFDFLGEDGYRPTRKGHPPISGKMLGQAHLQLESGRLEWDTYDDVACAYRVKGLTMIIAQAPDEEG